MAAEKMVAPSNGLILIFDFGFDFANC